MFNTLKGMGIAVSRPVAQATKLNALIRENDGEAISFPLIDIVPLQDYSVFDNTIKALETTDLAIFISSNAVQNGMPRVLTQFGKLPTGLKFAAIGPVTASELMQMGAQQVLIPKNRFDSESLLSLPEMQAMQGKKVMIFRGVGGRVDEAVGFRQGHGRPRDGRVQVRGGLQLVAAIAHRPPKPEVGTVVSLMQPGRRRERRVGRDQDEVRAGEHRQQAHAIRDVQAVEDHAAALRGELHDFKSVAQHGDKAIDGADVDRAGQLRAT